MPARKRSQSVGRSRGPRPPRRTRVVGLGPSAGAFLALGLGPLAAAPTAHADEFGLDNILEPILTSMTNLDPALSVGLDHWAASLDSALSSFAAVDPTTGLDHWATGLEAALGSFSATAPTTALAPTAVAASSIDTLGSLSSVDPTSGVDSTLAAASSTET